MKYRTENYTTEEVVTIKCYVGCSMDGGRQFCPPQVEVTLHIGKDEEHKIFNSKNRWEEAMAWINENIPGNANPESDEWCYDEKEM